ncbi:unnamed protein product [Trifolium pratense]|uniref:Uncharacterized protein n=1 Tax=Trifolium pratense TaxID=57577 RepID=A0ACB0K6B6_TRIPR|nr:unnamed protein product [Trifolium pratense]
MESPRTPISSPLPLSIFMESPHTPISSPSSLSSVTPSPRTPLCESPMMDHTPPISPRTPISSPSSVTPSPPRAPKKSNKQRMIYSTPMLRLMDRIIQDGELWLLEYRRNQNTAQLIENERKRKIKILMSLR